MATAIGLEELSRSVVRITVSRSFRMRAMGYRGTPGVGGWTGVCSISASACPPTTATTVSIWNAQESAGVGQSRGGVGAESDWQGGLTSVRNEIGWYRATTPTKLAVLCANQQRERVEGRGPLECFTRALKTDCREWGDRGTAARRDRGKGRRCSREQRRA